MTSLERGPPVEGKEALGPGARVWRNRVTLGGRQLRLGRDGRWYGFARASVGWDLRGAPDDDPSQVADELVG
ncbi:MAG: hypothetical protein ACXV3F_08910 [Frankiaceae bacterium]